MFEMLLESSGGRKRRTGGAVLSLVVHAMVVAGAVQATERMVRGAAHHTLDTTIVFVEPKGTATPADPGETIAIPAAPEPLPDMASPEFVQVGLPPIDIGVKPFDPSAVTGTSGPVAIAEDLSVGSPAGGARGVFVSAEVDDPAIVLSQPTPRYPTALQSAGVSGHVELEYVVDSSGHAETASVRVLTASHAAFVAAATEAVLAGVYRPARYRGSMVRQLVRQRVVFGAN